MTAMTTKSLISTLAAAMLLTGCGYAPLPVTPTQNDWAGNNQIVRQQATAQLPKGVTAKSVIVTPANATARVGESFRMSVAVKGSDGKTYNDPRLVSWSISNPQLGTVDQNGVLLASMPGSVKVMAMIGSVNAQASIQIDAARYAWQEIPSPTRVDLRAVKMVSRFEAWAGGDRGTMLRFVNGAWHKEPTFQAADANVKGLGFANSGEGWAVGTRGTNVPFISHYKNGMWRNTPVPVSEGSINAISVINERDAWAVGEEGKGGSLILHWNGKNWLPVQAPGNGSLNDIHMLSNKRGWAVGDGGLSPTIFKFVDGEWRKAGMWDNRGSVTMADTELKAIKMVSETQGYAVGVRKLPFRKPMGLFLEYDPKRDGWVAGQYDKSVKDLDQVPLHDLEMISGTEGWALGDIRQPDFTLERNPKSIFGNLLANQGGVLKLDTNYFSGNLSGAFYAIDLLPQGEGFVVGQNGVILHRTYDWRGANNGGSTGGYGDTYGGNNQTNPITYGPGGQQVPVVNPSPVVY